MREQKKFKKIVEDRLDPVSDDIISKLKCEFPEYDEQKSPVLPQSSERKSKRERTDRRKALVSALCGVAAAAVACAIIIPVSVNYHKKNLNGNSSAVNPRYITVDSDLSIKEYNAENGANVLFLDLYDGAAYETKLYTDKSGRVIYGISESYDESGGSVVLDCIFDDATVKIYTTNKAQCTDETTVNGSTVYFCVNERSVAVFEYDGIKYCLSLSVADADRINSLVAELLT